MEQFTIRYIGQQSGLDFAPQSDTTLFRFEARFRGKVFSIDIRVANIDLGSGREDENKIIKFGYDKIQEMIGKPELESATYRKIGDELEKEK